MTIDIEKLKRLEQQARVATEQLGEAVSESFPPGTTVDYFTGGRWIGPCEIESVSNFSISYHGPEIRVHNLNTDKRRNISTYDYIRLWRGYHERTK